MITKKHFKIVADIIKQAKEIQNHPELTTDDPTWYITRQLANFFSNTNPRFNASNFYEAAGFRNKSA